MYKLTNGRFSDQFGKDSKHQQLAPKMRHIAPFPFKQVAKIDEETRTVSVLNGEGKSIDVWSSETYSQLLRIDKKGDFKINCFDKVGSIIAYSDCKDTQIFNFDKETLQIQKLTQKVCS
jgi:hypothetical protein